MKGYLTDPWMVSILAFMAVMAIGVAFCVSAEERVERGRELPGGRGCANAILGAEIAEEFITMSQAQNELNGYLEAKNGGEKTIDLWFNYKVGNNETAKTKALETYATMFTNRNTKLCLDRQQAAVTGTCALTCYADPQASRDVPVPGGSVKLTLVLCR